MYKELYINRKRAYELLSDVSSKIEGANLNFDSLDVLNDDLEKSISDYVSYEFMGCSNEVLEFFLSIILNLKVSITDQPEEMNICNGCGMKTLHSKGEYEICKVCEWEDDGYQYKLHQRSSINRGTPEEYRKKLSALGLKEGKIKLWNL